VLADPAAAENPFFLLFPTWLLAPAILLTTAATVIASQAVLSGAFALVQQAIQLGAIPRLEVRQTSKESAGQVYVPQINWLLAALVLALVFGFRSSDALANAYGIAVAGDMMVTTLLVTVVAYALWRWPAVLVFPVAGLFFLLDLTFVPPMFTIPAGGWFPLLVGFIALTLMLVWRKGRRVAFEQRDQNAIDLATFIASLDEPGAPERMNGTVVYLTKETHLVPAALELNVRHNGIVHRHVVLLKVTTEHSPRVDEASRVKATSLASGFRLLWLVFGVAEKPDVPAALRLHPEALGCDLDEASFFLGRETPVPSLRPHLS
jgi:KUP system potassium uptake protein